MPEPNNEKTMILIEIRFDTSNYKLNRPLPRGKNKKLIRLMKDELSRKIM